MSVQTRNGSMVPSQASYNNDDDKESTLNDNGDIDVDNISLQHVSHQSTMMSDEQINSLYIKPNKPMSPNKIYNNNNVINNEYSHDISNYLVNNNNNINPIRRNAQTQRVPLVKPTGYHAQVLSEEHDLFYNEISSELKKKINKDDKKFANNLKVIQNNNDWDLDDIILDMRYSVYKREETESKNTNSNENNSVNIQSKQEFKKKHGLKDKFKRKRKQTNPDQEQGGYNFIHLLENNDTKTRDKGLMKQENWKNLIDCILMHINDDDKYHVLKNYVSIAKNLLKGELKYTILYLSNKQIIKQFINRIGGYEFLIGLGFRQKNGKLICNNVNNTVVSCAIEVIKKELKVLKKAKNDINSKPKISVNISDEGNQTGNDNDGSGPQVDWNGLLTLMFGETSDVEDVYKSLKTMKVITENLFQNDAKYRTIYIDNKKIHSRVISKMGGTEFFHELGFRQKDKTKLVCNNPDFTVIKSCLKAVTNKLNIVKAKRNK